MRSKESIDAAAETKNETPFRSVSNIDLEVRRIRVAAEINIAFGRFIVNAHRVPKPRKHAHRNAPPLSPTRNPHVRHGAVGKLYESIMYQMGGRNVEPATNLEIDAGLSLRLSGGLHPHDHDANQQQLTAP